MEEGEKMQFRKFVKTIVLVAAVAFVYHGEVQAMDGTENVYSTIEEQNELLEGESDGENILDIEEKEEKSDEINTDDSVINNPQDDMQAGMDSTEETIMDEKEIDSSNETNNEIVETEKEAENLESKESEEVKLQGWKNEEGKTYYYKDGEKYKGELYENGYWYFLDSDTGELKRNGFAYLRDNNKWCYYNKAGQMLYGEACINAGWYYLTPETGAVTYKFQYLSDGNKWVYYGAIDGRMNYGEQYIDAGWYYLTPGTGAVDYEWSYIPTQNKWVYYDPINGRMQYGQHKIDGKWYYFDECTGRVYSENEIANRLVRMAYSELHKNTNVVEAIQKAGGIVCPYGPCMTFVWYTFNKAGLSGFLCDGAITGYPHHNYDWYNCRGKNTWVPKVGDIAFFRWNGWADEIGASSSHAGIIVGVNGGYIQVIDAMADGLGPHNYSMNDYALIGYANPFV